MNKHIKCHFQSVKYPRKQKLASDGREFDLKKKSNDPRICPEALGVTLRVAKHLETILASPETIWDNFKKIEKNRFFQFFQAKDMIQILGFPELLFFWITTLESPNQKTELDGMFILLFF